MPEWLTKHAVKLLCGCTVTVMGYIGSTYETRLTDRLNTIEQKAESKSEQLARIEQKLDDVLNELRRR